jgi:hypothetical protein
VRDREIGECGDIVGGLAQHGFDLRQLPAEHVRDGVELLANMLGVGLGEDGADRRRHHLRRALGHLGQHVTQEMHPAALPGRADQDGLDRAAQPGVGVGDHQLHPGESAGFQRPQKRCPKRAVLGVSNVEAEYFATTVGGHAGGDHHRL